MAKQRVGLLAPMRPELRPLVKKLSLEHNEINGLSVHSAVEGDVEIVATTTGIGTEAATTAAQRMLDAVEVDRIIVVGIAGGIPPHVTLGDLVIPEVVVDAASGKELHPVTLGTIPANGRLVTSDEFHVDEEKITQLSRSGVTAVDMETASVGLVCEARGVPWSTFRSISDMAGDTDTEILGLAGMEGNPNVRAVIRYLAPKPWRIRYLVKLAKDSVRAADIAASAAVAACRSL
jgi:nucleoside phosphorylase